MSEQQENDAALDIARAFKSGMAGPTDARTDGGVIVRLFDMLAGKNKELEQAKAEANGMRGYKEGQEVLKEQLADFKNYAAKELAELSAWNHRLTAEHDAATKALAEARNRYKWLLEVHADVDVLDGRAGRQEELAEAQRIVNAEGTHKAIRSDLLAVIVRMAQSCFASSVQVRELKGALSESKKALGEAESRLAHYAPSAGIVFKEKWGAAIKALAEKERQLETMKQGNVDQVRSLNDQILRIIRERDAWCTKHYEAERELSERTHRVRLNDELAQEKARTARLVEALDNQPSKWMRVFAIANEMLQGPMKSRERQDTLSHLLFDIREAALKEIDTALNAAAPEPKPQEDKP